MILLRPRGLVIDNSLPVSSFYFFFTLSFVINRYSFCLFMPNCLFVYLLVVVFSFYNLGI